MNIIEFVNKVLDCVEVIKYNKLDWYDLGLNRWYDPMYLIHLEKTLNDCQVNHPNKKHVAFSIKINSYTHDNFCYESYKHLKEKIETKTIYVIIPQELEHQLSLLREIDINILKLNNKHQCHCRKSYESYSIEHMDISGFPTEYILK